LGDVIEKPDGSVYGNGVNVAARLQALAAPGNTLVSEAVRSTVGERTGCRFESQGKHVVRNIAEPVHTYRLADRGTASQAEPSSRQSPELGIASDRRSSNLPEELHAFFGRERELAEIRDLLRSAHLLTVTGTGGIGKTRLALRAAAEARDAYRWCLVRGPRAINRSGLGAERSRAGVGRKGVWRAAID